MTEANRSAAKDDDIKFVDFESTFLRGEEERARDQRTNESLFATVEDLIHAEFQEGDTGNSIQSPTHADEAFASDAEFSISSSVGTNSYSENGEEQGFDLRLLQRELERELGLDTIYSDAESGDAGNSEALSHVEEEEPEDFDGVDRSLEGLIMSPGYYRRRLVISWHILSCPFQRNQRSFTATTSAG